MNARMIVLYATREGQTEKVARRIATALDARGVPTDVANVREAPRLGPLVGYDGVVLAASLHANGHEPEMVRFARENREELARAHAAFVSVSLSEAGAEDPRRPPADRARFADDVAATLVAFEGETGWHPERTEPVAGALAYSKYNPIVRFVMRRIARKVGGDTDTSRDYEYTDWGALDRFAGELADDLERRLLDGADDARATRH